ncbi:MAG: CvpA family protein [Gillisia sp.]
MNILDVILALLLLYGLVRGLFRGFLAELASVVAFILGIYGAIYFSYLLKNFLFTAFNWNPHFVALISFALTFILIVLAISWIGAILTKAVNIVMLGFINRLLGGLFGIIKIAFITSIFIMIFKSVNTNYDFVDKETIDNSVLYPSIKATAPALLPSILTEAEKMGLINEEKTDS